MKAAMHSERGARRLYRARMRPSGLVRFDVEAGETDLTCFAEADFSEDVRALVGELRRELSAYGAAHPGFFEALDPLPADDSACESVRRMCAAAAAWGVGPMAAVAGTFAEMVAELLARESAEVIVENGGDIYIQSSAPRRVALFAGDDSPFDDLSVLVRPGYGIRGICTSSATVGHSLSFGAADAVAAFAKSAAFADAAATAICNRVKSPGDVERIVEDERKHGALLGLVVIMGETLGAFGAVEFV